MSNQNSFPPFSIPRPVIHLFFAWVFSTELLYLLLMAVVVSFSNGFWINASDYLETVALLLSLLISLDLIWLAFFTEFSILVGYIGKAALLVIHIFAWCILVAKFKYSGVVRVSDGSNSSKEQCISLIPTPFFTMSLDKALRAIKSKWRKLGKPKNLGKRIIPLKEITPYLTGDLRGCYDLLQQVLKFHREYTLSLCVSSPMMAGKIFRRYYMKKDFKKPNQKICRAALLSYHGGKNSFVGKPGWYKACWDLDINSAYAEAMRQLPDFSNGRWVYARDVDSENYAEHGILRLSGKVKECRWGIIFNHDFKKVHGDIDGIWSTSYEIKEALASGELRIQNPISGWVWIENKKKRISPFKKYVDDFYEKKSNATDPSWRVFYKHMLTDLYGKFIARVENDEGEMVCGGMFDPAIASLITGFVRAKIHRLEHRYNAIHTATDGFITQRRPRPSDIGSGIGMLKQETFGPVVILRNKLYLHYDETGALKKSAMHGFELPPEELMKVWKSAKRTYRIERLVSWAEAWHCGLPPGMPVIKEKTLHLN